jgi:exodeoxyribonuclease VII small subunit
MSPTEKPAPATSEPESFEAAIERLEDLVTQLESGDVPLEKSLSAFEEGRRLIVYCEQKLQAAEQVLKKLAQEAQDSLGKDVLRGGQ